MHTEAVLGARGEDARSSIEAVGGRPLFALALDQPFAIALVSDAAFHVDGRYHAQIAVPAMHPDGSLAEGSLAPF
jgi:hypothetical protein